MAVAAGAVTAAAALLPGVSASSAAPSAGKDGLRAVGLTAEGELVRFRTADPSRTSEPSPVTGLGLDARLIGIDYRVQNGALYGVGDAGGIYELTPRGAATQVSQLSVPLEGENFGVDFNPAADRLRIVSDTGQNLRHDVNAAGTTVVDSPLTYPPTTTAATGVAGAAYTNNDLDVSTATSLFDIDTALDQVALQSPANSGQLSATGKLGVDGGPDVGFDVYSTLDDAGATRSNRAFATISVEDVSSLYRVSLLTGKAAVVGTFDEGTDVIDLAIRLNQ
jgi:hypothetical protein